MEDSAMKRGTDDRENLCVKAKCFLFFDVGHKICPADIYTYFQNGMDSDYWYFKT